ncbi:MAG: group II intron reverse transcriptase/maturase [Magnetococcales bacterium]|nr:group II intron reverse transcriptase/maturase [Magnetococcales bacterium]
MNVGLQAKEKPMVDSIEQGSENTWQSVKEIVQDAESWLLNIQRKLYKWSRANPDDAYRDMWNLVTDLRNLRIAWIRVSGNRGARSSGADKVRVKDIEQRPGIKRFLAKVQQELRSGVYCPTPVRRVMIPKRGKPGQTRPLGVPTVKDRVVQAAILQILEPIFEAEFLPVSYGYRPGKSCRDALEHIRNAIRPTGKNTKTDWRRPPYQWVIEGDIKGCFDNIDHHSVMTRLRRRVKDKKVNRTVLAFLKAGILHKGEFFHTTVGTPQGGILSPILANIVLSAIEERYSRYVQWSHRKDGKPYARPGDQLRKFRHYERKAGRPVFLPIRYADDFVVLVTGNEEQALAEKEALAVFLRDEMKLTLSPEKTHVTDLTKGFIFLGHRVRLRWDNRWGYWPRVEIPKDRIHGLYERIKIRTCRHQLNCSFQQVIDMVNPLVRGWGNYYRHCYNAKAIFRRADHYVWDRLRRWLVKKHPKTSIRLIYRNYWKRLPNRNRSCWADKRPVALMADIKVERHNLIKLRYPDYATTSESPVHNERCTPGLGMRGAETAGGNPGEAPPPYIHLKKQGQ